MGLFLIFYVAFHNSFSVFSRQTSKKSHVISFHFSISLQKRRVFFHSSTNSDIGVLLNRGDRGMIYQYPIHDEFGIPKSLQTHIRFTSISRVQNSAIIPF